MQENSRKYLLQHGIPKLFNSLILDVCADKPDEVLPYLATWLRARQTRFEGPPRLHHFPGSVPSRLTRMIAAALGCEVDLVVVDLMKGESRKPEYIANVHPLGKVPALDTGRDVIWESAAIVRYLAYSKGSTPLYPFDKPIEFTKCDQAAEWVRRKVWTPCGTLVWNLVFCKALTQKDGDSKLIAEAYDELKGVLQKLEDTYFKTSFDFMVGGVRSIADYNLCVQLAQLDSINYDTTPWPKISNLFKTIKNEPIFKEAHEPWYLMLEQMGGGIPSGPPKLYYVPMSTHARIALVAAKSLGVEVQVSMLNPGEKEHKKPEYITGVHPLGKFPALDIGGGKIIWESAAIVRYFAFLKGSTPFYPFSNPIDCAKVDSAMELIRRSAWSKGNYVATNGFFKKKAGVEPDQAALEAEQQLLDKCFTQFENQYFQSSPKYMVGTVRTVADVGLGTLLSQMEVLNFDRSPWPKIDNFYKELCEEEPFKEVNDEWRQVMKQFMQS